MSRARVALLVLALLARTAGAHDPAGPAGPPAEGDPLDAAAVEEQLGAQLPLEMPLRDGEGRSLRLGDAFDGSPVLLVLAYYHCRMLCGRVLEGLAEGLAALPLEAGRDYRVLTVSIDPRDTPATARERQRRVLDALGWAPGRWPFTVAGEDDVRALAGRLGFRYRFDASTDQFAHPAVVFATTPRGEISSYLYGVSFPSDRLEAALEDAAVGRTRSALDRVLLRCFHYVPALRRHADAIALFLRAGGAVVALGVGVFLLRLWRRDVARHRGTS